MRAFGFVGVIEEVVGVESRAVPVPQRIAVEPVGSGLGHVVDLRPGLTTVLTRISIRQDGGITHLIGAQAEIAEL